MMSSRGLAELSDWSRNTFPGLWSIGFGMLKLDNLLRTTVFDACAPCESRSAQ